MPIGPPNDVKRLPWRSPTVTVLFSANQAQLGGAFFGDGADLGSGIPG